jgi:hypothetical protein
VEDTLVVWRMTGRRRFDEVYEYFHPSARSPKLFLLSYTFEELGQMLCDKNFASEDYNL